jgi:hypothetical protein
VRFDEDAPNPSVDLIGGGGEDFEFGALDVAIDVIDMRIPSQQLGE